MNHAVSYTLVSIGIVDILASRWLAAWFARTYSAGSLAGGFSAQRHSVTWVPDRATGWSQPGSPSSACFTSRSLYPGESVVDVLFGDHTLVFPPEPVVTVGGDEPYRESRALLGTGRPMRTARYGRPSSFATRTAVSESVYNCSASTRANESNPSVGWPCRTSRSCPASDCNAANWSRPSGVSRDQEGNEPVTEVTAPVEQHNRLVRCDTRPGIRFHRSSVSSHSRLLRDATTSSPGL